MKQLLIFAFIFLASTASAQAKKEQPKPQIVAAACGQCQFDMEGHGCELAVRIDGKCYFVDGTSIDSHGDAHADDGFCAAIRKAEVVGKIVNNRFQVTSFHLIPEEGKGKLRNQNVTNSPD
nr:DUF6370 family protein [uncultured Flavobacterium sp.]